jgi:hypothetical protein
MDQEVIDYFKGSGTLPNMQFYTLASQPELINMSLSEIIAESKDFNLDFVTSQRTNLSHLPIWEHSGIGIQCLSVSSIPSNNPSVSISSTHSCYSPLLFVLEAHGYRIKDGEIRVGPRRFTVSDFCK